MIDLNNPVFDSSKTILDHMYDVCDVHVNIAVYTARSSLSFPDDLTYFTSNKPQCTLTDMLIHFATVIEHTDSENEILHLSHCICNFSSSDALISYLIELFDLIELHVNDF